MIYLIVRKPAYEGSKEEAASAEVFLLEDVLGVIEDNIVQVVDT